MKRRIVTRAEGFHKASQTPDESVDDRLLTPEATDERTHMQVMIDILYSSIGDTSIEAPTTLRIICDDLPPDEELIAREAGTDSEWIIYIPEIRSATLESFASCEFQSGLTTGSVAEVLTAYKDGRKSKQSQMGIWEYRVLAEQSTVDILGILVDAGLNAEQIRNAYVIFPEIRFRANGTWHALALGEKFTGSFEAFAIELSETWSKDLYILDRKDKK